MVAVTIENISNKLDTITRHQPARKTATPTGGGKTWEKERKSVLVKEKEKIEAIS